MNRRNWIQILVLTVIGACASPSDAGTPHEVPQRELIKVGETRRYDTDFKIKFLRVATDNRCPVDVECRTPGDAVIVLRIKVGNKAAKNYKLHTQRLPRKLIIPAAGGKSYAIRIASLSPQPFEGKITPSSSYRLDLKVSIVR